MVGVVLKSTARILGLDSGTQTMMAVLGQNTNMTVGSVSGGTEAMDGEMVRKNTISQHARGETCHPMYPLVVIIPR